MPQYTEWIFSPVIRIIAAFLVAFLIALRFIPVIINIARRKNLVDEPNHRTSHQGKVPTLGGIAIYAGFSIAVLAFNLSSESLLFPVSIAGATILFFWGVKDDILELSPLKKLYGQIIASLMVILLADLRLTDLHGFLGFNEIPYFAGVLITLFVFLLIVNSFNLVDGIDGLAAGLAIVSSVFLGEEFLRTGQTGMLIMVASLIGALLAFLKYNLLDKRYKIFMGDTGSMLLGFIIAVMIVKFNELNVPGSPYRTMEAAPAFSLAILIVPIFDTIRLFVVRLYVKCSPFAPDRAHMHHLLLKLGFSHLQSTYVLMLFNIAFVLLAWRLQYLGTMKLFWLLMLIATVLTIVPFVLIGIQKRRRHDDHRRGAKADSSQIA